MQGGIADGTGMWHRLLAVLFQCCMAINWMLTRRCMNVPQLFQLQYRRIRPLATTIAAEVRYHIIIAGCSNHAYLSGFGFLYKV